MYQNLTILKGICKIKQKIAKYGRPIQHNILYTSGAHTSGGVLELQPPTPPRPSQTPKTEISRTQIL
jgi:hypothetical protein